MIYESEILTSWETFQSPEGQLEYFPHAARKHGIHNWEDATGAKHTPPDPNLLVILARTEQPPEKLLRDDPFSCVLWSDEAGDIVHRRGFCSRQQAERIAGVIDRMAGADIGRGIVGGDTSDMALTVVAWRLKMWIRSLPHGR